MASVPGAPGTDDLYAIVGVGRAHHHAAADVHRHVMRTRAEVEEQVAGAQFTALDMPRRGVLRVGVVGKVHAGLGPGGHGQTRAVERPRAVGARDITLAHLREGVTDGLTRPTRCRAVTRRGVVRTISGSTAIGRAGLGPTRSRGRITGRLERGRPASLLKGAQLRPLIGPQGGEQTRHLGLLVGDQSLGCRRICGGRRGLLLLLDQLNGQLSQQQADQKKQVVQSVNQLIAVINY